MNQRNNVSENKNIINKLYNNTKTKHQLNSKSILPSIYSLKTNTKNKE